MTRLVQSLATGYRFAFDEALDVRAVNSKLDDSAWEVVALPHTWNALDATLGDYRRGAGWYRLRFRGPPREPGSRAYLRCEGIATVSTLWLNGAELGRHWSAHSAACYDASDLLRPDAENLLVVRADNGHRDDVPPREGDFTMAGGIHRAVSLIVTGPLAIDALDHAGPGLYLTTPEVLADRALLRARVRVRNTGSAGDAASVVILLLDAQGNLVATRQTGYDQSDGVSEHVLELEVPKPRLWHGRLDPYLYSVVAELRRGPKLLDRVEQPLGFRSFHVDPERGFFLNGEPYELRGANLHQDVDPGGLAVSRADRERDFQLLLELGATFVRLVHYQHDDHAHQLADRLGLLVWAEHGLVGSVDEDPAFAERAARQLTELIRQSANHPSIVVWGIGNEVKPRPSDAAPRLLERLARLVKREDPSRPSALATCFDEPAGAYGVDLIAHNKYFGWYSGDLAEFPRWLDAQRLQNPELPMGMSEYGSGAGVTLHSDEPAALDHSEEYQSLFHEAYWTALRERPWLWCKAVWQMFDAASAGRDEGERPGVNDKGLVTRDRRIKKDAFFWYQANWTDEPMVYVASRRFSERRRSRTAVKVFSNCSQVSLHVNGRGCGVRDVRSYMALWTEIELTPGQNRIEVAATRGSHRVCDSCLWVLLPDSQSL